MKKVSVIVAVYNAAAYIRECLESLVRQTYPHLEIWCVDDCSTDNSRSIVQQYADKDDRIHLLSTPVNSGPAVARNMAIERLTGDLTAFLDSDDWLSDDAIEKAVSVFESHPMTDCVLFTCMYHHPDGSESPYAAPPFSCLQGQDAFVKSLTWAIHGIYIARSFLYKQFPYDTVCRTYSDDNTTRIHYYQSREVRMCGGIYYYRMNPHSISHIQDISQLNYLKANESMKRQLTALHVGEDILNLYEYQRWLVLIDTYRFYYLNRSRFTSEERKYCLSEIQRIWKNVETFRIPIVKKCKLGYAPLSFSWTLFCIQEEIYFGLKKLFGLMS